MIINATTGTGFGGALSYVNKENVDLTKETEPEILELNHVFGTPKEQAVQMRFVANENSRSSRPVLHLSVSFSLEEKLEQKKISDVLKQVLREFGATPDNNQYAILKHNDAGHEHYHIVLNKVGFDGTNIDTSYVQNRAHVIADKIEQQQGLKPTEGRRILYDTNNERGYRYATKQELAKYKSSKKVFKDKKPNVKKAKEDIQNRVIDVLRHAKSSLEFKANLAATGVDVRYSEDRENGNTIRGASFRTDKFSVTGGDIGFKWDEISKILETNLSKYQMPVPTEKEQKEINFEQKFVDTLRIVTNEINVYVNAGELNCIKPVLEQRGFKEIEEGFVFTGFDYSKVIPTRFIKSAQDSILKSFNIHQQKMKKYTELMDRRPDKISFMDILKGKTEKKEAFNTLLAKQQKSAIEPVFKIEFYFPFRYEKSQTNFEKRMEQIKKAEAEITKVAEQKKPEISPGRRRGR